MEASDMDPGARDSSSLVTDVRKGHVNGKSINRAKRQRFLEKQSRAAAASADLAMSPIRPNWLSWIEANGSFAQIATRMTIEGMRSDAESPLYPYFDMQERPSVAGIANDQLFIAEGTETIRLLLQQLVQRKNNTSFSPIQVKSIFVKPSIMFEAPVNLRAEVDNIHQAFGCVPFDVVIAQNLSIQSVVTGFEVARGALACGVVPKERDWNWLLMYLGQLQHHSDQHSSLNENDSVRSLKLVALDGVSDSANLGSIIRTAAAFNVDAILLSSTCCDAWYRRTVRVSMGHVFNLPCVRVHDLPTAIQVLAQEFEIQSYAAVVQHSTDLTLERVEKGGIAASWMAVFGSEGSGISRPVVDACTYTLRIDMKVGVDSLSLPIAAGIILHGLHERSRTRACESIRSHHSPTFKRQS